MGQNIDQLEMADHHVRSHLIGCLEERFIRLESPEIAFRLALCFKLGFDRPLNEEKCLHRLCMSGKYLHELDREVRAIKSRKNQQYPSKKVRLLLEKGFLH